MKRLFKFKLVFIILIAWASVSFAQQKQITGKVIAEEDNMPLPGVSVVVKGTTTGTATGIDGDFTLSVPSDVTTLIFSFIGFDPMEVDITGKTNVDIALKSSSIALDEVVAIGYGVVKKSDLTGAVSSVSSESLEEQPTARLEHTLQGRSPGVVVQRSGGNVGRDDMKIRIRGTNSITGNNQPLVVIDGYLGGSLGDINPNDVAAMEVLSDASATAIYGSRGSNGVIIVTTKKGKVGKTKVSYSGNVGVDFLTTKVDLFGAVEYMENYNEISLERSAPVNFSDDYINEFRNGTRSGTDWQDVITRTALKQEHQVSLSGGSEKVKYFNSIGYSEAEGVSLDDQYQRFTFRSNLENKITDFLTSTLNVNYTRKVSERGNHYDIKTAYQFSPNLPVIDPETGDYQLAGNYGASTADNPVQSIELEDTRSLSNTFKGNLALDFKLLEGLTYRFFIGTSINDNNTKMFTRYEPGANSNSSAISQGNSSSYSWQLNNQLNYMFEKGDHNFNATVVQELAKSEKTFGTYGNTNLVTNSLYYYNIGVGSSPSVSSGYLASSLASVLGRVNYTLANKYLLSLSMRADGASKFAADNKWAYYPSGAIAWQMHREGFFEPLTDVLSTFKLRASVGKVGSQAIDSYQTLNQMDIISTSVDGTTLTNAAKLASPANSDLMWETTTQANLGFNATLLGGKFTIDADYYYKKTEDLLYDVPQPYYTGIPRTSWNLPPLQLANVGSMMNQGFTFDVNAVVISKKDISFEVGANFSYNQNEFLGFNDELSDDDKLALSGGTAGSSTNGINIFYLVPGNALGEMYGLEYLGTWKEADRALAAEYAAVPGDPRYLDVNEDQKYDNDDASKIGNGQSKFNAGLNLNFTYKAFDVSALFQGSFGFDILNLDMMFTQRNYTSTTLRDRYTPDNESDTRAYSSNYYTAASTQYMEKGNYFRLNNLSIGYTLPSSLTQKAGISNCRLYLNGQNLFTITNYSGVDPSASSTGTSDLMQGVSNGVYPIPTSVSMGVNVSF